MISNMTYHIIIIIIIIFIIFYNSLMEYQGNDLQIIAQTTILHYFMSTYSVILFV